MLLSLKSSKKLGLVNSLALGLVMSPSFFFLGRVNDFNFISALEVFITFALSEVLLPKEIKGNYFIIIINLCNCGSVFNVGGFEPCLILPLLKFHERNWLRKVKEDLTKTSLKCLKL